MNTFSIIFVCTGNRFRSPLAEAFVRRLTLGLPVSVESFGILNLNDSPALREAIELAHWCGIDLAGHRARQLGSESLEDVDLLLGFERAHIRHAVVESGAPRDRSFTLLEFLALLDDFSPNAPAEVMTRARQAVDHAVARRGGTVRGSRFEVSDPFGRSWKIYRSTAEEVRSLSIALVRSVFGLDEVHGLPALPPKLRRPKRSARR
jgi:protein-tyrosine phosphatase